MCITPARCFPDSPSQLYSSTNPHHGKRRGLFTVTLNLLFQSCILALCNKIQQLLKFPLHHSVPCMVQSQNPQVPSFLDQMTPLWLTISVQKQSLWAPQKLHYLFCYLFCSFSFWKSGYETELITPGSEDVLCGVLNCSHFFLMPWPIFMFKYQQLFLHISAMPTALQTSKGRSELTPMMLLKSQSRGEVN